MYICCFKIHCWCCLFVCCCVTKKQSSSIISSIEYCKLVLATQIFWHPVQRNLLWICPKLLHTVQRLIMPWRLKENQKPSWNIDGSRPQAVAFYSGPLHFTLSSEHITYTLPIWRKKQTTAILSSSGLQLIPPIRLQSFNLILANLGSDPASQLSESDSANQHQHKYTNTNT